MPKRKKILAVGSFTLIVLSALILWRIFWAPNASYQAFTGQLSARGQEYVQTQIGKGSNQWQKDLLATPEAGRQSHGGTQIETACGGFYFPFQHTHPETKEETGRCSFQAHLLEPVGDVSIMIESAKTPLTQNNLDEVAAVQLRRKTPSIYTERKVTFPNFIHVVQFSSTDSVTTFAQTDKQTITVSLSNLSSLSSAHEAEYAESAQ